MVRPLRLTLTALVMSVGLGGVAHGRPAPKVDWSEYIEAPGARTPVRRTETPRVEARSTKQAKNKKKHRKSGKVAKRAGTKHKKRAARGKRR
ncbi:MAG: hypothetical protein AB7P03_27350 [Kofleriaceae bacterium]